MKPGPHALGATLTECASFEDAGRLALDAALAIAEEALASSAFAGRGRVLRAMVHLRPSDGYKRLLVIERPDVEPKQTGRDAPYLPSATAWRAVAQHRCPVSIDVALGSIRPEAAGAALLVEPSGGFDSHESRQRLLTRAATHVYVMPLRGPRRAIDGMITLEADCRAALGQDFIWPECGARLMLVADVAAPYLTGLPLSPTDAAAPDELLPVIGPSMSAVVEMLRVFAQQDETLLVGGPTGAGKSRLARWCHEQSARRAARFEMLDLSAVPEELQMGELFGWRKGAFTGAVRDNPGCLDRAEGGTVFIDEIDKLSLKSQAGLLHVLEERTYRVLGDGTGDRRADVRFIVGTNADLGAAVRSGRFREDLYYRINVLPVKIPPLDERRDEISSWARYMAQRRHREGGAAGEARLAPDAERLLLASAWPGNLRQLDNIIRRAYALALLGAGAPAGGGDLVLDASHLERALQYEDGRGVASLVDQLTAAARTFALEAERRSASGAPFDLDLADAFRGFVLGTVVMRAGKDEAFRVLGKESLIANRNHHKTLRRELERVSELCRALGHEPRLPFLPPDDKT